MYIYIYKVSEKEAYIYLCDYISSFSIENFRKLQKSTEKILL